MSASITVPKNLIEIHLHSTMYTTSNRQSATGRMLRNYSRNMWYAYADQGSNFDVYKARYKIEKKSLSPVNSSPVTDANNAIANCSTIGFEAVRMQWKVGIILTQRTRSSKTKKYSTLCFQMKRFFFTSTYPNYLFTIIFDRVLCYVCTSDIRAYEVII